LFRGLGERRGIAWSIGALGLTAVYQGEYRRAAALSEESLALSREAGDALLTGLALSSLGVIATLRGDARRATLLLQQSLALFRDAGDRRCTALAIDELAAVACADERPERAAQLFSAGQALREAVGAPRPPAEQARYDRSLAAARVSLGERAFAVACAQGRRMTTEQAVQYALAVDPADGRVLAAPPSALDLLTAREQEVVALVSRGLTNRQIADELIVSERTAEAHVSSSMNKLGLTSRAQLAVWAADHGLRDPVTSLP
jgi:non-specific serine/threonine protein kinase